MNHEASQRVLDAIALVLRTRYDDTTHTFRHVLGHNHEGARSGLIRLELRLRPELRALSLEYEPWRLYGTVGVAEIRHMEQALAMRLDEIPLTLATRQLGTLLRNMLERRLEGLLP